MRMVLSSSLAVGTNEVAEVSVIEASWPGLVLPLHPRLCSHYHNVILERQAPTAVLLLASPLPVASLSSSARSPTAVFAAPVIFLKSAESPTALLLNPVRYC